MRNLVFFFKSNWLFILLATVAFSLVGISLFSKKTQEKRIEPTSTPVLFQPQSWRGITPGQSLQKEVIRLWGQPTKIETRDETLIFYYSTESEALNHKVFFGGEQVGLIKEQVVDDQANLSSFIKKYGEPEAKLYGPYAASGFLLYIFSSHGIAVLAHPDSGIVFEVWYFIPMSLDQFTKRWGGDLSVEPPKRF